MMTNEIELIADQIASGYRDGAWPGISVRDIFRAMPAAEAASHPIAGGSQAISSTTRRRKTGPRPLRRCVIECLHRYRAAQTVFA
jgi:hypothetical protein